MLAYFIYSTQVCPENGFIQTTDFGSLEPMDLCAVENITTSKYDDDGDDDDLYIIGAVCLSVCKVLPFYFFLSILSFLSFFYSSILCFPIFPEFFF